MHVVYRLRTRLVAAVGLKLYVLSFFFFFLFISEHATMSNATIWYIRTGAVSRYFLLF